MDRTAFAGRRRRDQWDRRPRRVPNRPTQWISHVLCFSTKICFIVLILASKATSKLTASQHLSPRVTGGWQKTLRLPLSNLNERPLVRFTRGKIHSFIHLYEKKSGIIVRCWPVGDTLSKHISILTRRIHLPTTNEMTSNKFAAVTLTFGDRAENHVGMQIIGTLAERGFTLEDLLLVASRFPSDRVELLHLHDALPTRGRSRSVERDGEKLNRDRSRDVHDTDSDDRIPEAYVLVIRNGLSNHQELMQEMMTLDWDKKALMRGRVVNKSARYNLCFDDEPSEP